MRGLAWALGTSSESPAFSVGSAVFMLAGFSDDGRPFIPDGLVVSFGSGIERENWSSMSCSFTASHLIPLAAPHLDEYHIN
jgi:hypothetical protein